MSDWQSRAIGLIVGWGFDERWARSLVIRFCRGDNLKLSEVEIMSKVLGVLGAVVAGSMAVSTLVRPNTAKVIETNGTAFRSVARAAMSPQRCDAVYPLTVAPVDGRCRRLYRHDGLHIQTNGFAFNAEDIRWAAEQMALITE